MIEMFLRNALSRPVMAVPIKVTVTTPMTMPRVVSMERILLTRIAPHEMLRPSFNSVKRFMTPGRGASPRRSCHVRSGQHRLRLRSPPLAFFVASDEAVANAEDAPGVTGDVFFVSDNH